MRVGEKIRVYSWRLEDEGLVPEKIRGVQMEGAASANATREDGEWRGGGGQMKIGFGEGELVKGVRPRGRPNCRSGVGPLRPPLLEARAGREGQRVARCEPRRSAPRRRIALPGGLSGRRIEALSRAPPDRAREGDGVELGLGFRVRGWI